jgi:hypothetical protein
MITDIPAYIKQLFDNPPEEAKLLALKAYMETMIGEDNLNKLVFQLSPVVVFGMLMDCARRFSTPRAALMAYGILVETNRRINATKN